MARSVEVERDAAWALIAPAFTLEEKKEERSEKMER